MKLTRRFIAKVIKIAVENHNIQHQLSEAMIDRYGITHSDIDDDQLIDVFDYGTGGRVTLEEIDEIMTNHGHPPRKIIPCQGVSER